VAGIGLRTGLFPGRSPWTLTVAPAILGAAVIAVLLCMRALPNDFERRITPLAGAGRRTAPARAGRQRALGSP